MCQVVIKGSFDDLKSRLNCSFVDLSRLDFISQLIFNGNRIGSFEGASNFAKQPTLIDVTHRSRP
jgi:hypothetical protein